MMAVEDGDRRRLAQLRDEFLQMRSRHVRQSQPGEVGVAKLEDPGPEREFPPVAAHVAQLHQGEQEPAGSGPGQPGSTRYLAQAQPLPVRAERPDDREPAIEGLHEVAVPRRGLAVTGRRFPVASFPVASFPVISAGGRLGRGPIVRSAPGGSHCTHGIAAPLSSAGSRRARQGQPVRSTTKAQSASNAARTGTSGSASISSRASMAQCRRSARAMSIAG